MKAYRNTNEAYGMPGPFEAESREALANEMMPTFREWAKQAFWRHDDSADATEDELEFIAEYIGECRREFISSLEEVQE